jgi:putative ABC transport system ATP-binding protein
MKQLITTEKITRVFNNSDAAHLAVLHEVSLTIGAGEFVAIVGKSGSGKTTLMNILGCLDTPTSGTYLFDGFNVVRADPDTLAGIRNEKIGFVFQTFNLLEDLTALDNVALPQLYAGSSERVALEKAREQLTIVGLEDRLNYYPNQLSGGQKQRVAIARSLINRPMLILADEPTGNLDSKTGTQIFELFKNLNAEHGITFIIVTHDRDLAQQTGRTIELVDGVITRDSGQV